MRISDWSSDVCSSDLTPEGPVTVTDQMATQIHRYLIKNAYIDDSDQITDVYYTAKADGTLAALHEDLVPYQAEVFGLIDSVYSDAALPKFEEIGRASCRERVCQYV